MKKKKKMMISERKERKGNRVEREEREGQRGNLCQHGVWRRFVAERERECVCKRVSEQCMCFLCVVCVFGVGAILLIF